VPNSGVVLLGKAGQSLADISGGGAQNFTSPAFSASVSSERYINQSATPQPLVVDGFKQDYLKGDSLSHMGGALAFGVDGKLYVSVGDGTSFDYADPRTPDVLSLRSLSGKILRVDPMTGQGLPDNPFVTAGLSLDSNQAKVFQLGFRNPFSMAFDGEGRLFVTNTGWFSWESLNMGGPGASFGWPY
jgi:glucose/arabinose dehydrogenase